MAMGRFKLSFTAEESEIPSLVCHAPSNTENFRSPHEEVADTWLYTVYLKKRFITKLLNMFRLKRTGKINGSQVLKEFKLAN